MVCSSTKWLRRSCNGADSDRVFSIARYAGFRRDAQTQPVGNNGRLAMRVHPQLLKYSRQSGIGPTSSHCATYRIGGARTPSSHATQGTPPARPKRCAVCLVSERHAKIIAMHDIGRFFSPRHTVPIPRCARLRTPSHNPTRGVDLKDFHFSVSRVLILSQFGMDNRNTILVV